MPFAMLLSSVVFAGLGLGDDHRALAFSDGRDEVDEANRQTVCARQFQRIALKRKHRNELFIGFSFYDALGGFAVDRSDIQQRKKAFAFFRGACFTRDHVARAQAETADLRNGDVYVVLSGEIVFAAEEAVAVRQHLQHALRVSAIPRLENFGYGRDYSCRNLCCNSLLGCADGTRIRSIKSGSAPRRRSRHCIPAGM